MVTALDARPPAGVPILERQAARALLVDPRDRVLLFEGFDPHQPERGRWWFTPGGGLEAGEDDTAALTREVFEETGCVIDGTLLGGPVWWRRAEFFFAAQWYRQTERFYLVRIDDLVVDTTGLMPIEASSILSHAWWSVEELARTEQQVFPCALSTDLAKVLDHGAASEPYEIS